MALCQVYASSRFFATLHDEGFVDVRNHTTTSNGGLNQSVKFFVSANGQLQVAWSYSFHLKVLGGVACKFEYLSGEVFKDSGGVDRRCGTYTTVRAHSALQESVDSANRELKRSGG